MTYNVFGGTLSLTQSIIVTSLFYRMNRLLSVDQNEIPTAEQKPFCSNRTIALFSWD